MSKSANNLILINGLGNKDSEREETAKQDTKKQEFDFILGQRQLEILTWQAIQYPAKTER